MTRPARLLSAAALVLLAGAAAAPAAGAQACPQQTFLGFGHVVYASERPASVPPALAPGTALGAGTIDEPVGDGGCQRDRVEVQVVRAGELDPRVAVLVRERPGLLFVLGARCSGYEESARIDCLLRPLELEGRTYHGARYAEPPAQPLPLGRTLGQAVLGGETVTAVAIDGVDPAVAVAVEGRPDEAFVAVGACPYEAFRPELAQDDLRRCLRGPLWLVFDPLGGQAGDAVTARSDREVAPALAGATVSLARLSAAADLVPRDLSGAVPLGSLEVADGSVTFRFDIPDVEQGIYEAVLTCERCAESFGGQTVFPAGSILVFGEQGGSGTARALYIVLAVGVVLALAAAFVAWRRGWHRPRRPPEEPGPPPQ